MALTISPNMSLPVPSVGTQAGPTYAQNINSCLDIIDQHDHGPGSGVPVTSAGININSDLSFNGSNLTNARSLRMSSQGSPLALASDLDCLYVSGVDLYYNDGNGNQIQVTQNGGIAGSPGSISNLTSPASAAYVAADQTFVWQADSNVAATMDMRNAILRNSSASSKGLTLSPPNAMGADYTITLPALPGATNILTLTSSGTMAAVLNVDNASLEISANVLQVKAAGIQKTMQAAVGQQLSSSCGAFSTSQITYTDVTNLTVTITTVGRPVILAIISDGSGNLAITSNPGSGGGFSDAQIVRGVTAIANYRINNISGTANMSTSPSLFHIDQPAAGTYTYKIQCKMDSGGTSPMLFQYYKLVAYEL